jgi:hypothetical protein
MIIIDGENKNCFGDIFAFDFIKNALKLVIQITSIYGQSSSIIRNWLLIVVGSISLDQIQIFNAFHYQLVTTIHY